jgi:glycosyltransferase involved in cell wall biosynthesis
MKTPPPLLSVIVPAHQAENVLAESLPALCASDLPRSQWELIVVDDASRDGTARVAERYADVVIRIDGTARGPACARNRGSDDARGAILAFVDADVCVHPNTLRKLLDTLTADTTLSAVFGAYDTAPRAAGLVSQYRNLLHHYVHLSQPGEADTFWAGCGAVRKAAFVEAGRFDELRYPRPQIEDIELGGNRSFSARCIHGGGQAPREIR